IFMDVLFLHPPARLNRPKNTVSFMSTLLMGYGMLSVAAYLKREGYSVECWNVPQMLKLGLSKKNVLDMIKGQDPLVVGVELNWLHFSRGAIELCKEIKEVLPNVKVFLGGVHQTIFLEPILWTHPFIDGGCIGEAEKTFLNVVESVEKGKSFRDLKGLVALENGKIYNNGPPEIVENIDELPPYSLRLIKPQPRPPLDIAAINTCRGPCAHACRHCIGNRKTYASSRLSPRRKLAVHSPEWIIAQMEYLLRDVSKICIQDYIYCRPDILMDYAKAIQRRPDLMDKMSYFNMAALPGSISPELMRELSLAGIDTMDLGVESGSERVLRALNRPYTKEVVLDTIKSASKNGIRPLTFWMVGLPEETREDIELTKQFILETIDCGGIPRWVTPLCLFPTLELFERSSEFGITNSFLTFDQYSIYSMMDYSVTGNYEEAITHETKEASKSEIIARANELKSFIWENRQRILNVQKRLLEIYGKYHPRLMISPIEERNFRVLESIKGTFF
ncbi:MAG: B12-binding domain-containing radical SAM protein, partial [Candidatus Helarchaeales archaeon]